MSDLNLKPNVVQRIKRYHLTSDQIEQLVIEGFKNSIFLDGRPGTAQRVSSELDLGRTPSAVFTVTTLEQEYTERG